jgi:hypothetical protein
MYRPDYSRTFGIKINWFLNTQPDPLVNIPVSETHIKANQVHSLTHDLLSLSLSLSLSLDIVSFASDQPFSVTHP